MPILKEREGMVFDRSKGARATELVERLKGRGRAAVWSDQPSRLAAPPCKDTATRIGNEARTPTGSDRAQRQGAERRREHAQWCGICRERRRPVS